MIYLQLQQCITFVNTLVSLRPLSRPSSPLVLFLYHSYVAHAVHSQRTIFLVVVLFLYHSYVAHAVHSQRTIFLVVSYVEARAVGMRDTLAEVIQVSSLRAW